MELTKENGRFLLSYDSIMIINCKMMSLFEQARRLVLNQLLSFEYDEIQIIK